MPNYTKLFNSIVTSTIWTEDDKTRILWITMLAMADQNGEVHASIPGLARIAGIDIESAEKALNAFLSPDPYSRTPDNEGRRIAKIDGGWELLNHAKYRKMASKEDSKAAAAERVRRHRARVNSQNQSNDDVTPCNGCVTDERDIAEAEAKAKADIKSPLTPQGGIDGLPLFPKETPVLPDGWKKLNSTEQRRKKVNYNTPLMVRVGRFLSQRDTTLWTIAEYLALQDVNPTEDELEIIGQHYSLVLENNGFRYKDILTLLNNWPKARTRAEAYFQEFPEHRNI